MSDISFGSIYRIPITQPGVNAAKKARLKSLIETYPNGLIGKSKTGHARISVPDSEDTSFVSKLKALGYKIFQKFEGDNISKDKLDAVIKAKLDDRDFFQKGKQYKRMSNELKAQRKFERTFTPAAIENNTQDVQSIVDTAHYEPKMNKLSKTKNSQTATFSTKSIEKNNDGFFDSVSKSGVDEVSEIVPKAILRNEELRKSARYIELKEKYGEEFAEAVFFGIK